MELEFLGLTIETDYTPPIDDHLREGPGPQSGCLTGKAIFVRDGYTFEDCEEAWNSWRARLVSLGMTHYAARADAMARHAQAVSNHGQLTGDVADYFLGLAEDVIEDASEGADRDYCPEEEGINI